MRQLVFKNLWLFLLLTCTLPFSSFSQTLTGIWRGYFITESGDNYKLEFQVKQTTTYAVSGVSYSYLDTLFYGKATMTGNFVINSSNFRIREIRTVEVKNLSYGGTCIMNYDLQYSKSGKEEFLEGTYLGKPEVKTEPNPNNWGDCGGGKVFLRKVPTSDFYIEPFLRQNNTATNTSPKKPDVKTVPKTVTPPPVTKNKPVVKKNTAKTSPPVKKNNVAPKATDSAITKLPDVQQQGTAKLPTVIPNVLKDRQNELMKSLVVNDPEVIVKLFDNGEIDDDTISVYLDKKLILSNKKLTASPLTIRLKMDDMNPSHELVMVAENLGRIPPNTSLMVVEAGEQRFDVRITSTEQKNAVVRFRYEKL